MADTPFLGINELAELLQRTPGSIRNQIFRDPGSLPPRFSKPGERMLWHRDDVEAWIAKRREESQARVQGQRRKAGSRLLVES